jgi:MraZ protein
LAFRGHYEHSLDSKDRLTVPAKFRDALNEGVVLVAGLEPCVWIFPTTAYEGFSEQFIGSTSPLTKRGRVLRRHFHGESFDEKLDSNGRVHMPKRLVEEASLEGTCIVIGMEDYFEVWNTKRWQEAEAEVRETVTDVAENHGEES